MQLNENFENCAGVYIINNKINEKYYIGESLNVKNLIDTFDASCMMFHHTLVFYY